MFTTHPEITGTFGVAASKHWLASQVAMSVLERGGNAFDAAVAGGFLLQVVEPHLNGPGGEVPILLWSESAKQMRSINGQGFTISSFGFALGTRLERTWLDDGLANSLTPRVAPRTTLSHSLARRDGEPYRVFGTPGGDQQEQGPTAFFLRHAVHGMNLQEAIVDPTWHVKYDPGCFWPRQTTLNVLPIESGFDAVEIEGRGRRGHVLMAAAPWSGSRMSACTRLRDLAGRSVLRAGANARGMQGYAVGR